MDEYNKAKAIYLSRSLVSYRQQIQQNSLGQGLNLGLLPFLFLFLFV